MQYRRDQFSIGYIIAKLSDEVLGSSADQQTMFFLHVAFEEKQQSDIVTEYTHKMFGFYVVDFFSGSLALGRQVTVIVF